MGLIAVPSAFNAQPPFPAKLAKQLQAYNPKIIVLPCAGTNGIDGSVFTLASGASRPANNYVFNGGSGYVDLGAKAYIGSSGYSFILVSKVRAFGSPTYPTPVGIKGAGGLNTLAFYSNNATYSDIVFADQTTVGHKYPLTQLGSVAGTWHKFVYVNNGSEKVFCNGTVLSGTTVGVGTVSGNSCLGQLSPTNTGQPFDGEIAAFILFNGALPDVLALALSANPWLAFEAPDEEIFIGAGGSGVALASSALASATGSASLSVAIPIIGASAASTTGQGTLSVALPLAAAGAASVVGSATLNTNQALASSAAANTTGQGTLGVAQAIAGSGLATATGTGSLSLSIPINSAALANVIGSGTLQQAGALSAHGVADVTGQGTISLSLALSAAAIANAIGSGNLGVTGSFESHAVASAAGQGTLTQRIPISGVSLSATNGSGSLTQLVPISGSSVVLANGQGALHLTINMNAAALAQAMGVGNLTLRLSLSGNGLANAIGSATLGGMHRPINPEFFITGNSLVRYVLGNALIRSL